MKIKQLNIKTVKYIDNVLYCFNNIDKEKLNEHSEFMCGSVSKIFTAIMIIILAQNKLININDKINKYVPSNKNNDFSKIKIIDVLNHESGMKSMPDNYVLSNIQYKSATDALKTFIAEPLLILEIGQYSYSNIGYILLGSVIEKITQMPYYDAYYKYIFKPLKMTNTNVGETNIKLYNLSKKLTKKEYSERFFASSTGGFHSCVKDFINFGKNINKLLNKNSLKILSLLYFCKSENNIIHIEHSGSIVGGKMYLKIKYFDKFIFNNINIIFEAN